MDLVLLVYAISLLDGFGKLFVAAAIVSGAIASGAFMYRVTECCERSYYDENENARIRKSAENAMRWIKISTTVLVVSVLFNILLPSQKTAYMMVGAYAAQKVAESDKFQVTGGKVLTLINQKLDKYIEDGPEEEPEPKRKRNRAN